MRWGGARGLSFFLLLGCVACPKSECGPLYPCTTDSQCAPGQYCDHTINACAMQCDSPCAAWQQCTNAECVARYASLQIVSPGSPAYTNGPLTISTALNLAPGEARADPPSILLLTTFDAGSATQSLSLVDAGLFSGTWAQSAEGSYQLIASWPDAGLTSSPLTVFVDHTPPVFTVAVPPPPSRPAMYEDPALSPAWKRDEYVAVTVTCDKATVDPNTVQFLLTGLDGGAPAPSSVPTQATPMSDGGCQHAYCGIANLDLSLPLMNDFTGTFGVQVRGQDLAGNIGTWTSPSGLPVTRFRWFNPDAGVTSTGGTNSPAIGSSGTIYSIDASNNELVALSPNGDVNWRWSSDGGFIYMSPVVRALDGGDEAVFVVTDEGVFSVDGITNAPPICSIGGKFPFAMAVAPTTSASNLGTSFETAFIPLVGQSVLVVMPDAPAASQCTLVTNLFAFNYGTNAVTDGQTLYVGDSMSVYAIAIGEPFRSLGPIAWTTPSAPSVSLALVGPYVVVDNGTDPAASFISALERDAGTVS